MRLRPCMNCGRPTRRQTTWGRWCWPCAVDFNAAVSRDAKGFPMYDPNGLPIMLDWPPMTIEEAAEKFGQLAGKTVNDAVGSAGKWDGSKYQARLTKEQIRRVVAESLDALNIRYPGLLVTHVFEPPERLDVYPCASCGKASVHSNMCRRCASQVGTDAKNAAVGQYRAARGNSPKKHFLFDPLNATPDDIQKFVDDINAEPSP